MMKRALVTLMVTALALPLAADEAKTRQKETPETAASEPAESVDSPLVAAAKRANRLGKKPAFVITNETLKDASSDRITTTDQRPTLVMPPPYTPPPPTREVLALQRMAAERKAAEKKAALEKKSEEERQQRLAMQAAAAEEGEGQGIVDLDDLPEGFEPPPQQ